MDPVKTADPEGIFEVMPRDMPKITSQPVARFEFNGLYLTKEMVKVEREKCLKTLMVLEMFFKGVAGRDHASSHTQSQMTEPHNEQKNQAEEKIDSCVVPNQIFNHDSESDGAHDID